MIRRIAIVVFTIISFIFPRTIIITTIIAVIYILLKTVIVIINIILLLGAIILIIYLHSAHTILLIFLFASFVWKKFAWWVLILYILYHYYILLCAAPTYIFTELIIINTATFPFSPCLSSFFPPFDDVFYKTEMKYIALFADTESIEITNKNEKLRIKAHAIAVKEWNSDKANGNQDRVMRVILGEEKEGKEGRDENGGFIDIYICIDISICICLFSSHLSFTVVYLCMCRYIYDMKSVLYSCLPFVCV